MMGVNAILQGLSSLHAASGLQQSPQFGPAGQQVFNAIDNQNTPIAKAMRGNVADPLKDPKALQDILAQFAKYQEQLR